jgi:hypothetical protein
VLPKKVRFVELNTCFNQKTSQFIGKGDSRVMLFLAINVLDQPFLVLLRMSERALASLPARKAGKDIVCFDPVRRAYFDLLHKICQ